MISVLQNKTSKNQKPLCEVECVCMCVNRSVVSDSLGLQVLRICISLFVEMASQVCLYVQTL